MGEIKEKIGNLYKKILEIVLKKKSEWDTGISVWGCKDEDLGRQNYCSVSLQVIKSFK